MIARELGTKNACQTSEHEQACKGECDCTFDGNTQEIGPKCRQRAEAAYLAREIGS